MTTRHRFLAAAALMFAAGAAQAQTGRTSATPPTAAPPMSAPAGPAPTTPAAPPAMDATPPASAADAASATPPSGAAFTAVTPAPGADMVTVLTQSGQFTTLLKAADATNLTSVLKTANLTVFAPTDTAFAALPPGTLDNLMKPENLPQLQKLLAYHLVNTKIPSIKGHASTQVATAAGPKVTLDGSGDAVKVNDATTLQSAVAVGGGATLYPIDKVLSPDFVPPPHAASDEKADSTTTTTRKTTTRKPR